MKEEKKESPIGVLWGWGKPYHGKFIGSIILAVLGVACQMVPYFLSLIHISEPTRQRIRSRMPSSA